MDDFDMDYEHLFEKVYRETNWDEYLNKHRRERLKKLYEMYRRPDFSYIPDFLDELHRNPNSIKQTFSKYKIELARSKSSLPISGAEYNDINDKYIVKVSSHVIKSIIDGTSLGYIAELLTEVLTHEETHRQQNQLNNKKQKYVGDVKNDEYLSQYVEIDAMARQVARSIEYNGGTEKNLSNIRSLKMSELAKEITNDYFRIGGETLEKFLKEIFNYFTEPHIGDGFEYSEWLKHNRGNN